MLDYADSCLKQLEEEGGDTPPGLVEVSLTGDLGEVGLTDALDILGYDLIPTEPLRYARDLVDRSTGECVREHIDPTSGWDAARIVEHERQRASVLVEALENVASNQLFHAGEETRELARRALREFEEVCGG